MIETLLAKQKTSVIRCPAGLFITLFNCAKDGTLIVAEALSAPPRTHPSHHQKPMEDHQAERDHHACCCLYESAKTQNQSIKTLAKETGMEHLLKTEAYVCLVRWMASSKKRE